MISILEDRKQRLVSLFNMMQSDEDKYLYLCHLGKQLPKLAEHKKSNLYLLANCQTKVWIDHHYKAPYVSFEAEADSLMISGLIKLIFIVYNDLHPQDIANDSMNILTLIGCQYWITSARIDNITEVLRYIRSVSAQLIM